MNPSRALVLALVVATIAIGFVPGFSSGPFSNLSGAPGDDTCVLCHGSFALNAGVAAGIANFEITGPDDFVGQPSITLGVDFANTTRPRHGFEITARDASGIVGTTAFPGDFTVTDPANTTFAFFGTDPAYVTHNFSGSFQSSWSLDWAPNGTTPAGPVTFYAAGNAANGDGGTGGDYIFTAQKTVYQARVSTNPTFAPNSVQSITLTAPGQPVQGYILVVSEDPTPFPATATFDLPVNPFAPLATFIATTPGLTTNFIGFTDATGSATASMVIPFFPPSLSGFELHFAFVTFDILQLPNLAFTEVSARRTVTFQ